MICHIWHQMSYFGFLSYFANFHNFNPKKWEIQSFLAFFFFSKYLTRFYKNWSFLTDLFWNIWNNGKRTQKYRWNSCFSNRDWLLSTMKPNKTDFLCFIWKFLSFFNVIFHLFDVIFRDFKCHKKDIFGVAKCHIITVPRLIRYLFQKSPKSLKLWRKGRTWLLTNHDYTLMHHDYVILIEKMVNLPSPGTLTVMSILLQTLCNWDQNLT